VQVRKGVARVGIAYRTACPALDEVQRDAGLFGAGGADTSLDARLDSRHNAPARGRMTRMRRVDWYQLTRRVPPTSEESAEFAA